MLERVVRTGRTVCTADLRTYRQTRTSCSHRGMHLASCSHATCEPFTRIDGKSSIGGQKSIFPANKCEDTDVGCGRNALPWPRQPYQRELHLFIRKTRVQRTSIWVIPEVLKNSRPPDRPKRLQKIENSPFSREI